MCVCVCVCVRARARVCDGQMVKTNYVVDKIAKDLLKLCAPKLSVLSFKKLYLKCLLL